MKLTNIMARKLLQQWVAALIVKYAKKKIETEVGIVLQIQKLGSLT